MAKDQRKGTRAFEVVLPNPANPGSEVGVAQARDTFGATSIGTPPAAGGSRNKCDQDSVYLGKLSENKYDADSISNPYSQHGSKYGTNSVNNPYSSYGSKYSPYSSQNPYATDPPKLYAADGTYLGKLSENRYDPESISNPYGQYGSKYSPTSINNPYGQYGSRYSPLSPGNPYTTTPPSIFGKDPYCGSLFGK